MSNDRHHDEQVSMAYRSLADEKTPPHLDDKILKMAATRAKQPVYARWIVWSRPLAWAATITLCLAITLELTREQSMQAVLETPAMDSQTLKLQESKAAPAPAASPQENVRRKEEQGPVEEIRELETVALEKEQARDIPAALAESYASEKTALGRSAARQPPTDPAQAARLRQSSDNDAEVRAEAPATAMMMSADSEAEVVLEEIVVANECSDDLRIEPEIWLECILQLEEAGDTEAATRQRDALKEAFPDFKMP